MTINFYNNKAYSGHNGALSGRRGPGGGSAPPSGCVASTGQKMGIGSGTANGTRYPAYGLYDYGITMTILRQSDIGSGQKRIVALGWEIATNWTSTYVFNNQTIKVAHIPNTQNNIPNNTWRVDLSNITGMTDLTTCKSNFTWNPGPSGLTQYISLDDYFCYNGTDNLLVIWENRDGSWQSGYGSVECTIESSSANFRSARLYQDNSYPSASSVLAWDNFVPNIRIGY